MDVKSDPTSFLEGVGIVITAIGAGVAAILTAVNSRKEKDKADNDLDASSHNEWLEKLWTRVSEQDELLDSQRREMHEFSKRLNETVDQYNALLDDYAELTKNCSQLRDEHQKFHDEVEKFLENEGLLDQWNRRQQSK